MSFAMASAEVFKLSQKEIPEVSSQEELNQTLT